ncbi:PHP domain-containing protein, partial [Xanthomonas citri pv. citri]
HMHTPLCKHAVGLPGDYAAVAEQKGLKGIIVTCHAPMPDGYSSPYRMGIDEWDRYVAMVAEATEQWRGRVDIRLGLESEYVPTYLSWIESLHQRTPLNHVLGSVHCQMHEYIETCFTGSWPDFQRTYFRHLAEAAETGFYDTISHPDLVKN